MLLIAQSGSGLLAPRDSFVNGTPLALRAAEDAEDLLQRDRVQALGRQLQRVLTGVQRERLGMFVDR
jgi:hypothetical protein